MTSRERTPVKDIPGWKITGNLTLGKYDSGDGFVASGDFGPVDRGTNSFVGGPSAEKTLATQTIDLSAAAEIDAGRVRFFLSGYLSQAWFAEGKVTLLTAMFKDASGKPC